MSFINDPDFLDRFQVAIDPVYQTISLRGSGTFRTQSSTASGTSTGFLVDSTTPPGSNGAVIGDIVAVVSDPGNNGGVIGHYKIVGVANNSGLRLDRTFPNTSSSGISYRIYSPGVQGTLNPSLADGVTMQALYSFLKEEWRNNSLSSSGQDLIKFTFPMVSITSEQFEIGGVSNANWEFANDTGDGPLAAESSRNLIRTGGWSSINSRGQIIENYPSIVTLGFLEDTSQVYYQLTSETTAPNDFVLTGPVNQAIRTLETIGGVTTTGNKAPASGIQQSLTFTAATKNISAGATNLHALGFTSGELIQIRNSVSNNGLFTITASGAGATSVTVAETIVNETSPATTLASPMTDNRDYLVLRVRTKGKSYGQSEIADIGVSVINTIVNRFPLAEVDDPAIILDDGALAGDGVNTAFQSVVTTDTGSDGDFVDPGNGLITFTATSASFNIGGPGVRLYAGDTLEITGPPSNPNIGVYEVQSVDSGTQLTLVAEPGRTVDTVTNDGALQWTSRSAVRVAQASDGATADSATPGQGTFTSASSNFTTAGVVAGDILRLKSGSYQGFYKVVSVTNATTLEVNTLGSNSDTVGVPEDQPWGSSSTITFDILRVGMNLQYKRVVGTTITGVDTFSGATFTDAAVDATYVIGGRVVITGTANNNGTYLITNVSGTTVTVVNVSDPTTSPTFNAADNGTGTVTTEYGFVRKLGNFNYSFNWKLEANNGDLGEVFQFLQKELRQSTDIDLGSGTFRGDITDLLMTFASPNGVTLNLFLDNVDAGVLNNLTQQDVNGASRNFPFLVALKIALNNNILNANTNKIVVFYTDFNGVGGSGDEFGTTGAIIVQDSDGINMVGQDVTVSPLTFLYDYTAGGNADVPITIVCITDDTGQYVATTADLTRTNEVNASLVAGLERNYSNPS
jgi:hypothetical protein